MSGPKNRKDGHQPVVIEQVLASDAQERLARAFDLILRAAGRAEPRPDSDRSAEPSQGTQNLKKGGEQ
jgi:hypothetical protein